MTTIVGIQGSGYSVMASDTRITGVGDDGSLSQMLTLGVNSPKIFQNGRYIIGVAGDMRAINLLNHAFQPPSITPSIKGRELDVFITTKFIPSLRSCFDSNGYSPPDSKDKEHIAEQGSCIMISINTNIYIIDTDYAWASDSTGIYACGSGADYALGALHVLTKGKKLSIPQAKNTALKALAAASKFDPATGIPFQVYIQE